MIKPWIYNMLVATLHGNGDKICCIIKKWSNLMDSRCDISVAKSSCGEIYILCFYFHDLYGHLWVEKCKNLAPNFKTSISLSD